MGGGGIKEPTGLRAVGGSGMITMGLQLAQSGSNASIEPGSLRWGLKSLLKTVELLQPDFGGLSSIVRQSSMAPLYALLL